MHSPDVLALFLYFLMLSFLAIGAPHAALPEMHRYVVEVHHWMSSQEFAAAYALAQAAPGPQIMYVTLIGWQVGGWAGAVATTLPQLVPAATVTLLVGRLQARYLDAPLSRAIRRGLAPITIGLLLASAWLMLRSLHHGWRGSLMTLLVLVLARRTSWNPLWLLAAGALAGMVGLI